MEAEEPVNCSVSGTVKAGSVPLPGVVLSVVGQDNRPVDVGSSSIDGSYAPLPGPDNTGSQASS
jgi:hypothetical protein